jgi:hypothetical protein
MPLQAEFPWWMIFVFFGMFMAAKGAVRGGRRPERLGGRARDEIKRLEETVANRDAVIDDLQHRMSELESRLDFTERLLSEKTEVRG